MNKKTVSFSITVLITLAPAAGIFAAAKSLSPENRNRILTAWFNNGNDFMTGRQNRIEVLGKSHGLYYSGFKGLILYGGVVDTASKITGTKTRDFYSLAPLEMLSGQKVFLNSGPAWDTWGNRRAPRINRLNPAFVSWVFENMIPDPKQRIGQKTCHEIYQKVFARFARLLADSYFHLEKNNLLTKMRYAYESDLNKPPFDALMWLNRHFGHTLTAYRTCDGEASCFTPDMAFGFWIRRSIDGTYRQIWEGLSDFMMRYDYLWFNQRKHRYMQQPCR